MSKRKLPKDNKQPEMKDNSQVKIAIITGIVAIITVIITAIGGPVILKILDRTPEPADLPFQTAVAQVPPATVSTLSDTTQLPSITIATQYPKSLLLDATVMLNGTFGEVIYKILETQIDIYNTENLSLKFLIRMTNNDSHDEPFGWDRSRLLLLVDEVPQEPINTAGDITIVPGQSAKEKEFLFVFPISAKNLILRISHGEATTEIPINLNATKP